MCIYIYTHKLYNLYCNPNRVDHWIVFVAFIKMVQYACNDVAIVLLLSVQCKLH